MIETVEAGALSKRDEMLTHLHAAVAALETGDPQAFEKALESVASVREMRLAEGVARIARRVHEAIHELDLDSRLACLAGRDIPDACTHLDYVVRMTEAAAHRTLDLVDHSRDIISGIAEQHEELAPGDFRNALEHSTAQLRSNMSALSQAQEYQDLSGQLIRKVIKLVQEVEIALRELLRAAGAEINLTELPSADPKTLQGPSLNASSQQDADALLADLGF